MSPTALAAERIRSLDISLNGLPVGTLVRTPGDYSAFNLFPAYRSLKKPPIFSLSLRSADGSLRREPKPIRGSVPPFFANLYLPKRNYGRQWKSSAAHPLAAWVRPRKTTSISFHRYLPSFQSSLRAAQGRHPCAGQPRGGDELRHAFRSPVFR